MIRVFVIAGEASGDRLGAALMQGLKDLTEVEFHGVGGPLMQAQGLQSLFPMQELSVMGIAEVLPKYRHLLRRMHQTAQAVVATRPDVLITIDSPDFTLRVARQVRKTARIRTVHYVAPSVWAWRPGRAAKMAPHVDQVLCLLPFEPPYMQAAGMRADFVGHPVTTEPRPMPNDIARFRAGYGLGDAPILLALPGSRKAEVSRLMPVFGQAITRAMAALPGARIVLPAAPHVVAAVRQAARDWPGDPVILDPTGVAPAAHEATKRSAFAAAHLALAASGTVSLELARAGVPMVIAYDMNWLSWQIMSRAVRVDTVTLVNLVSGSRSVPEFLGPACQPAAIATALASLWPDSPARQAQKDAMAATMQSLGQDGPPPGLRGAQAVLDGLAGANGGPGQGSAPIAIMPQDEHPDRRGQS